MTNQNNHMSGQLMTAADVRAFVLAGNATFTLVSKKTGARFTYKVREPDDMDPNRPVNFVSVMYGPDNEGDFAYIGQIFNRTDYRHGRKSKVVFDDVRVKAFVFMWNRVSTNNLPDSLEVWHEGKCGRCGRKLTVPESIAQGFGPECVKRVCVDVEPHDQGGSASTWVGRHAPALLSRAAADDAADLDRAALGRAWAGMAAAARR